MGYDEDYYEGRPVKIPKIPHLRWIILGLVLLFSFWIVGSTFIVVWLNIKEFGELFLRPFYFMLYGGGILSIIAFLRLDFVHRRSLAFWLIQLIPGQLRRGESPEAPLSYLNFNSFKLSPSKFLAWQVTKVLVGTLFLANTLFGMVVYALNRGWQLSIGSLWRLLSLPFVTPPFQPEYAMINVVPMVPALTLLVGPIMGAVGIRLFILVGATQLARILSPTEAELSGKPRQIGWRLATFEGLVGLACFWAMFNLFFPTSINYNTRYIILGLAAAGAVFLVMSAWDKIKNSSKGALFFTSRRVLNRFLPILLIALVVGAVTTINDSIADARKVEWLGPYTVQQIAVNRYFAELDHIREVPYNFSLKAIPEDMIEDNIAENMDLLSKVRLWDWEAGFAKLKPEIGLIPYVDYQDSDILRFNGTLYWSASMKPILPETVLPEDRWYAEHLVYTHVPNGFYILNAHEGVIEEEDRFFKQRRIYYGEGGLLSENWATYPLDREESEELEGHFYIGDGGIDLSPPLSWLFEFNFFLAYRTRELNVIRYRDVYDRMEMLFPYFQYDFHGKRVDMFPVTDGENTYYMMPLIVKLDTGNVPWGVNNPLMRLVGYALINVYDGDIQLLITGEDYFSELFKDAYSEYIITEIPEWLYEQTRYPEELFEWRVGMYNFYHVLDPATFIQAKEFFEVPEGLDTYYIMASPPGFEEPNFVGLLSLELRGAKGRNLAGYILVENDYLQLGEMTFYEVPLESKMKLLGPTGTREALEKNAEFATLRTLLRTPRVGDNILYRVGEQDVYFIPVYTAGVGGVVTEIGAIACVGASFTGQYYVGLGETAEDAYKSYLFQVVGIGEPVEEPVEIPVEEDVEQRKDDIVKLFEGHNITTVEPIELYPDVSFLEGNFSYISSEQWDDASKGVESFIDRWGLERDKVLTWSEDDIVYFGFMVNVKGVTELHYITIILE